MAATTGLTPELLEPEVDFIFFDTYQRTETEYTQCFKVKTSEKAFEDAFKVAGLGNFVLKPEGTPISYDDPVQGPRKRVTHSMYALGFRVTEEMRDDDQHGIIMQMPADLAKSAVVHQETVAFNVINTAFVTTSFTTLDGAALCSTAHTELKTGATASNELSPGVALSHTGLESMLTQIELTQDDQGRPIKLNPRKLLIHPNDRWEAARLLETQQQPGSADNDINTMTTSRTGLMPFVMRYATDTDNWFIQSEEHSLTWYNRKTLTRDQSVDGQTKDMLFDARYRASVTVWDWYGLNGSQV